MNRRDFIRKLLGGLAVAAIAPEVIAKACEDAAIPKGTVFSFAPVRKPGVTRENYDEVKAVVSGEVRAFMGFKFVRTELLPVHRLKIKYKRGDLITHDSRLLECQA